MFAESKLEHYIKYDLNIKNVFYFSFQEFLIHCKFFLWSMDVPSSMISNIILEINKKSTTAYSSHNYV